jgi:hypothetical protein
LHARKKVVVFPDETGDFCRIQDHKKWNTIFTLSCILLRKKIFFTKNLQHSLKVQNEIAEKFGRNYQKVRNKTAKKFGVKQPKSSE